MRGKREEFNCSPVVPAFFHHTRQYDTPLLAHSRSKIGVRQKFRRYGWQADNAYHRKKNSQAKTAVPVEKSTAVEFATLRRIGCQSHVYPFVSLSFSIAVPQDSVCPRFQLRTALLARGEAL